MPTASTVDSIAVSKDYREYNHVFNETAVLLRPKIFQTERLPAVTPGPDEVTVQLQGCGVCASSLPVWEGRSWFEYPLTHGAPGHEGWGVITELGDTVRHLQIGQRVTFLGENAFARQLRVPAIHVVPLPPELDDMPFPGEAIACAMNIFERANIQAGQTVAIIGAGFLGLLLTQLAVGAGARVLAFSRRASGREMALSYGAEAAFDTEDWWGNAQRAVELTNGIGCERVIEVTGLQFALDTATELVAEYGRLVVAGFHQDGLRQVNMQTWNWRAIDVINAHERMPARYLRGMKRAVQAVVDGQIRPAELLTHRFNLEQLDQAFQVMLDRPNGFVKGWIEL